MNKKARPALILILTISIVFLGNCRKGEQGPDQQIVAAKKQFTITLTNPLPASLADHAVVLPLADIVAKVPDFNPSNCSLVNGQDIAVPFQTDDLDGDGKPDELAFLVTLPPGMTEIACRFSPTGTQPPDFPAKTYGRLAWETADANIGWESNRAAYRFYWGQLEAFGKLDESLIMSTFHATYAYHDLQPWGMDVLHVGNASGLGGISLWEGDTRISTINPAGKGENQYTRKVIAAGPVRAVGRVDIANPGTSAANYTITLIMSVFTNNIYSRQDILINSSAGGQIVYSPGIEKLPKENWSIDKDKGFLATWGEGAPGAGEVGLALIFNPAEYFGFAESDLDRFVKLTVPSGEKRIHWIYGGWNKGLTAPPAPQAEGWARDTAELAARLMAPIKIQINAQ